MGVTVLIESRRRTCGSSEAQEDLACRPVEDGGDTCRAAGDTYGVRYSRVGLVVWASKPGRRFRGDGRHVAASGSSRRGEATDEEARWPLDEDDTGLDHNNLGLSGSTQLYPGAKLGLCNSPVK
jgi:hypothetical protein